MSVLTGSQDTASSSCFVHDASPPSNYRPISRSSPMFHETRTPSQRHLEVRAATSDFPLVTFSVTDANRTSARARFYRRRFPFSHRSVFYHSQRSEPSLHAMSSPLRQRETFFVVIGTRRCVHTTAVLHASSREYGPPRVVSQRSEEYELSMNPTVSYPIVFASSTSFQ